MDNSISLIRLFAEDKPMKISTHCHLSLQFYGDKLNALHVPTTHVMCEPAVRVQVPHNIPSYVTHSHESLNNKLS